MNCSFCFISDTLISTPNGDVPINTLHIGDEVISFDEKINQHVVKKIVKTYVNPAYEIIKISFMDKFIYCTKNHPFYVNGEWIKAEDLDSSDKLLNIHNEQISINKIELLSCDDNRLNGYRGGKKKDGPVKVYNLEIEDTHVFYANNILVHNCDTKATWHSNFPIPSSYEIQDLNTYKDIDKFLQDNYQLFFKKNIVISGGEPLIKENLKGLSYLCNILFNEYFINRLTFETTTLGDPENDLKDNIVNNLINVYKQLDLLNYYGVVFSVSPKFPLSCYPSKNITYEQIYKYYHIQRGCEDSFFNSFDFYYKFVYCKNFEKWIEPLFLNLSDKLKENIYLMPLTPNKWDDKNQLQYKNNCIETAEYCKKHGFNYSPRLHVDLYGLKTGV
jgi:organic radical activating enzyme